MRPPSPEEASELRRAFVELDYTEEKLRDVLGSVDAPAPFDASRPASVRLTSEETGWNALVRLFFLGTSVGEGHFQALPTRVRELCQELELILVAEKISPSCLLYPFRDSWIAADRYPLDAERAHPDHVLTAGPAARHLSYYTATEFLPTDGSARVLDLCCGGGVHAVRLARHGSVIGADLNARSLEFARFNAILNHAEGVEFREGDGLAPVNGETFDLIVCNPPFVLTPTTEWGSCDNPEDLDQFCENLVRAVPENLAEGGRYQMIFEWVEIEGEDWRSRLASWVAETGCDAWFLHANQESPAHYTKHRMPEQAALQRSVAESQSEDDWLAYYDEHRVRAIHGGFLLLRKREGQNWIRFSEISGNLSAETGSEVDRSVLHFERIEKLVDESDLLGLRLRLRDGVGKEEVGESKDGRWVRSVTKLRSAGGLPQEVHVDPTMADLLGRFDGVGSVSEVVDAAAAAFGVGREQVESECLRVIRHFLERGWLEFLDGVR